MIYCTYINDLHYIIRYYIIANTQIMFTRKFFDDMKFCKINLIYVTLRFFRTIMVSRWKNDILKNFTLVCRFMAAYYARVSIRYLTYYYRE